MSSGYIPVPGFTDFSDQRLNYNDEIVYRQAFVSSAYAHSHSDQKAENGPYKAKVVDLRDYSVGVRGDGFNGVEPLYYVYQQDILQFKRAE